MGSKYEALASMVQADHDNWAFANQDDGESTHLVITHVLRILHENAKYIQSGSPVGPLRIEGLMDEIYDQIALNYTTVDFDKDDTPSGTPSDTPSDRGSGTGSRPEENASPDQLDIGPEAS